MGGCGLCRQIPSLWFEVGSPNLFCHCGCCSVDCGFCTKVEEHHEQAAASKQKLCNLFHSFGIPLEPSKLEGHTCCLTFLGIEVDTDRLQLRLPATKMERLLSELQRAWGRRTLTRWELQSLPGLLQHTSTVVRPGRAFLQRLYALQSVGSTPNHNVRPNSVARADIVWWHMFVS